MSPAHEYDLSLETRKGYIYAELRSAVMTPGVYRAALSDIRKLVLLERAGRLMFEYEAAHALTDEQTFELLNELIRTMPGMQIAIVARDEKHRPSIEFARSFGLDTGRQLRSFDNPAAAEKWLLDE
jgi:hypothetical protein